MYSSRHRPSDRAVDTLGELHVKARVVDKGFVQRGIVWMRQDLIDPAARHHVAAEEKPDRVRRAALSQRFDRRTYLISSVRSGLQTLRQQHYSGFRPPSLFLGIPIILRRLFNYRAFDVG